MDDVRRFVAEHPGEPQGRRHQTRRLESTAHAAVDDPNTRIAHGIEQSAFPGQAIEHRLVARAVQQLEDLQ